MLLLLETATQHHVTTSPQPLQAAGTNVDCKDRHNALRNAQHKDHEDKYNALHVAAIEDAKHHAPIRVKTTGHCSTIKCPCECKTPHKAHAESTMESAPSPCKQSQRQSPEHENSHNANALLITEPTAEPNIIETRTAAA